MDSVYFILNIIFLTFLRTSFAQETDCVPGTSRRDIRNTQANNCTGNPDICCGVGEDPNKAPGICVSEKYCLCVATKSICQYGLNIPERPCCEDSGVGSTIQCLPSWKGVKADSSGIPIPKKCIREDQQIACHKAGSLCAPSIYCCANLKCKEKKYRIGTTKITQNICSK